MEARCAEERGSSETLGFLRGGREKSSDGPMVLDSALTVSGSMRFDRKESSW